MPIHAAEIGGLGI